MNRRVKFLSTVTSSGWEWPEGPGILDVCRWVLMGHSHPGRWEVCGLWQSSRSWRPHLSGNPWFSLCSLKHLKTTLVSRDGSLFAAPGTCPFFLLWVRDSPVDGGMSLVSIYLGWQFLLLTELQGLKSVLQTTFSSRILPMAVSSS